jgi:hypothetical protein
VGAEETKTTNRPSSEIAPSGVSRLVLFFTVRPLGRAKMTSVRSRFRARTYLLSWLGDRHGGLPDQ